VVTDTAGAPVRSPSPAHAGRSHLSRHPTEPWVIGALVVLAVVAAFLGLAERVWIIDHSPINSDQAVVGLMAKAILHGHFAAFFWGQHYAGVEPYVTSLLFALFGSTDTVLNLTPVVLSITATYLVYLVGRYYLPRAFAVLAALAVWVWPLIGLTNSTEEIGYTEACLNCGLLAVLFATRIRRNKGSPPVNWALLGLSVGAGVWASPECVYFLVPSVLLVAPGVARGLRTERRRTASDLGAATAGTVTGGLPFWWATVTTHFATITHPNSVPYPGTLATRSSAMVHHAVPLAMGLQRPYTGTWFGSAIVAKSALVVLLIVLVSALVWAVGWHRPRLIVPLVVFVVAYLVIYPLFPPTFAWQDGRYIFFLPFVFIIVAMYPLALVPWRRSALTLGVVVVAGMACVTSLEIHGVFSDFSVKQLRHALDVERTTTSPLAGVLEKDNIRRGYAAYWLSYKLDFESGGKLTYSPIPTDTLRNNAYLATIDGAARPAWVVCQPANVAVCAGATDGGAVNPAGVTWASLTSWLHSNSISFRSATIDGFTVVVPAVRITPTVLEQEGVLTP
jgi:hypothetical protein